MVLTFLNSLSIFLFNIVSGWITLANPAGICLLVAVISVAPLFVFVVYFLTKRNIFSQLLGMTFLIIAMGIMCIVLSDSLNYYESNIIACKDEIASTISYDNTEYPATILVCHSKEFTDTTWGDWKVRNIKVKIN